MTGLLDQMHSTIKFRIQQLIESIQSSDRLLIRLTWCSMGSMLVYTIRRRLSDDIKNLIDNHSRYYNQQYQVQSIEILEITNRNRLS